MYQSVSQSINQIFKLHISSQFRVAYKLKATFSTTKTVQKNTKAKGLKQFIDKNPSFPQNMYI